ncbi:LAGLIDADG family homing endonuclease [Candidatus Woesearchaeota archaeon]|nr:LAGLIDADG family homing endonuclease [Candidatus Woesearchaeota archaeon]
MKNRHKNYDEYYLKFKNGEQKRFMRLVKEKIFCSWDKLANFLGISRGMIFLYLSEKSKLPKTYFEKMIKTSNFDPNNFKFKIVPYPINGTAKIPNKLTSELSEFVGVMLGDGNINKGNYQITVSGSSIDGSYITEYIPKLIRNLFSKQASFIKTSNNGLACRFSTKKVCDFLISDMKISSPKKNSVIPKEFFKNKHILKFCVRGLFDTDGGLHRHHKNSAQLQFTNKSYLLIYSLRKALIRLGFRPSEIVPYSKNRAIFQLYLFGQEVRKYFKKIGSSNPKNNFKFKMWIKTGTVPLNRETYSQFNELK